MLPVRGHAIIRLAALIKSGDKKALGNIDILVKTFRDNLVHEDSYIYLAAIEGLVAAADVRMDDVITYLVTELTNSVHVNMVYRRDCTQLNKGNIVLVHAILAFMLFSSHLLGKTWSFVD